MATHDQAFKQIDSNQPAEKRASAFFFKRNWWVFLFLGGSLLFYWHGMQKKEQVYCDLRKRLECLKREYDVSFAQRDELLLQISSQNDPAWIELILMKRLGLVPEGQTKIYFEETPP